MTKIFTMLLRTKRMCKSTTKFTTNDGSLKGISTDHLSIEHNEHLSFEPTNVVLPEASDVGVIARQETPSAYLLLVALAGDEGKLDGRVHHWLNIQLYKQEMTE